MVLDDIKSQLHKFIDDITEENITDNLDYKFNKYRQFISFIENCFIDEDSLEILFNEPDVKDYLVKGHDFFENWEMLLESLMQQMFIGKNISQHVEFSVLEEIRNYYMSQYQKLVKREIELAGITSSSIVCHVGVGSMPLSLIMHHKYSKKCKIVGIDYDNNAISMAKECIKFKCINEPEFYDQDLIFLDTKEGANYNYKNFSAVVLSSSISNKNSILNQIYKTANKDLILIDREVSGFSHYIYKSSKLNIDIQPFAKSNQFGFLSMNCYLIPFSEDCSIDDK